MMACEGKVKTPIPRSQQILPAFMPWPGDGSEAPYADDTIDWRESDPQELRVDPGQLSEAIRLVRERGAMAQLCVIRHGKLLLRRSFGCDERSLFWIFSASKPYIGSLIYLLADRKRLCLDDPVHVHWPELAARGKQTITIRHVLQHRSGLADSLINFCGLLDFKRSIRRIENAGPRWPVGAVPAYLPLGQGFILAELVQRVTGQPVAQVLAKELLQPLGARDTYLGLPESEWERRAPIAGTAPRDLIVRALVNRSFVRRAIIPAAGISTTACDLARFYFMLLRSGRLGGGRILSARAIEEARIPSSDGEMDRTVRLHIRWSGGFQLGGPRTGSISPFGSLSSPRAFGHNGSNCCIGWADPDRDLVFAYLTNRLSGRRGATHLAAVADAVICACR